MAKNRMINTRYWFDGYVEKLDVYGKLLLIYLFTNYLTEISGVYEISKNRMITDTKIPPENIDKLLIKFENDEKLVYREPWIYVKNFVNYQSDSDNIKKGIQKSLQETPKNVLINLGIKNINNLIESLEKSLNTLDAPMSFSDNSDVKNAYFQLGKAYNDKIHKARLTEESKIHIKNRLKTFPIKDLLKAIDNFCKSKWWMEHCSNNGMKWFFKNDDRIDKFLNLKEDNKDKWV